MFVISLKFLKGAQSKLALPPKVNATNSKMRLKNSIIDWLSSNKLGWESSLAKKLGSLFVNCLCEVLWYVDGNEKTLKDQCLAVPILFQHLQGYRQPENTSTRRLMLTV